MKNLFVTSNILLTAPVLADNYKWLKEAITDLEILKSAGQACDVALRRWQSAICLVMSARSSWNVSKRARPAGPRNPGCRVMIVRYRCEMSRHAANIRVV
jgi:hypothetical protein